jgi:hypothetical protein
VRCPEDIIVPAVMSSGRCWSTWEIRTTVAGIARRRAPRARCNVPGKPGTAEDILHAAACYAGEHDLMWQLWDLAGGNGNPEAHRQMADPAIRHQMVSIIQQARDKDAQAANHLEQALR